MQLHRQEAGHKTKKPRKRIRDALLSAAHSAKRAFFGKRLDTRLIYAAIGGERSLVKRLLEAGADINAKDYIGMTPLMLAAQEGCPEALKLLIKEGADVDARDDHGQTALLYAAEKGYGDLCHELLKNGADVFARKRYGADCVQIAATFGHEETEKFLFRIQKLTRVLGKEAVWPFMDTFEKCVQ